MSLTITDKYIDCLYALSQSKLSQSSIDQAKKCLLDYLGVTLAGAKILQENGGRFLNGISSSIETASVIGFKKKVDLYNAALINGMSAHIAELDDGMRQGSIHLGAPIISALLPLAEVNNLSGIDLIRGMVTGYEAAIRLACAIQPSHRNKGYHATGTCGTIGVAMGVAAALGFSKQQMKNALSAAATSSSGMLNVIKGSSELKSYNAGQAAVSGLMAAMIAQAGFTGSDDVLGGDWGLLYMVSDKLTLSSLDERNIDDKLGIEKVYIKHYAACRHCHPAIEAALELKKKYDIDPSLIDQIIVQTYHLAVNGHDHIDIDGVTSAKMSTPFSVAVALITGQAGITEFTDDRINNTEIISLAKKIRVFTNETLNSLVPQKRPAIVEVITKNNTYIERVDLTKGEPENPLSEKEFVDKFIYLSTYSGISKNEIDYLMYYVLNIETNKTIGFVHTI